MAVYKRSYRGYAGALTPEWSRFLVLYRYASRTLFRSKLQIIFFVVCFFFPLLCMLGIYANDHLSAFSFLGRRASGPLLTIDGNFFGIFLGIQCTFAFILTAFVGPGLVSPDLSNGALTLYLCRPLSRADYVAGKLAVLFIALSGITWIPGLLLFIVQACLSGWDWTAAHWFLVSGIVLGSLIWIFATSLLALALSAWVKWRFAAGALLLAVFFMGAGFAQAINAVLRTKQGYLIDLSTLINIAWKNLLRIDTEPPLPVGEAWVALIAFAACCLYLLMKKVKANEVVR